MTMRWIVVGLALWLVGCAATLSPRERALVECERQVAHEMGYDVRPDGTWHDRSGSAEYGKVLGSGKRIGDCLRARGYRVEN